MKCEIADMKVAFYWYSETAQEMLARLWSIAHVQYDKEILCVIIYLSSW